MIFIAPLAFEVKGSFDYENRVLVVADDKKKVLKNFRRSHGDENYIEHHLRDSKYFATPDKFIKTETTLIDPPSKEEFEAIDLTVRAYERKAIREGWYPKEEEFMQQAMNVRYSIERKRRPVLHYSKEYEINFDTTPYIRMNDVEDVVETLYLANKLVSHIEKAGLLKA